jgi:hypothetical protein
MKAEKRFLSSKVWIACAILCAASISYSVHPQTNDPKTAATNANPPPQSVFKIPASQSEGMRDPFFPKSTRIFANAAPVVQTPKGPVVFHADLKLQGMSGPPDHRLPIINGRTFELNEEAEVPTSSGKVSVKVAEIHGDTVIVTVNGERQTLQLRKGL